MADVFVHAGLTSCSDSEFECSYHNFGSQTTCWISLICGCSLGSAATGSKQLWQILWYDITKLHCQLLAWPTYYGASCSRKHKEKAFPFLVRLLSSKCGLDSPLFIYCESPKTKYDWNCTKMFYPKLKLHPEFWVKAWQGQGFTEVTTGQGEVIHRHAFIKQQYVFFYFR